MNTAIEVVLNVLIAWGALAAIGIGSWLLTPYESAGSGKLSRETRRILLTLLVSMALLLAGVITWETVFA